MPDPSSSPWYVYMLICRDETIYTGITTDPQKRLAEHNSGANGAKYTRSRRPVSLAYLEELPDRSTATSREYQLKLLSRQQKLQLIKSSGPRQIIPDRLAPCQPESPASQSFFDDIIDEVAKVIGGEDSKTIRQPRTRVHDLSKKDKTSANDPFAGQ